MNYRHEIKINARFRGSSEKNGVHRYASSVSEALQKIEGLSVEEKIPPNFLSKGILGHIWEQIILPLTLKRTDILLSPCNFGPFFKRKQIIIIHDTLVLDHKAHFKFPYRVWSNFFIRTIVLGRKRIVTVSANSLKDLERNFLETKKQFQNIGMGINFATPKNNKGELKSTSIHEKYFLFVGGHIKRKNLKFLIDLWQKLNLHSDIRLLVTYGDKNNSIHQTNIIGHKNIEFKYLPDDEELSNLYRNCQALLWPSLGEGFGMPLLEVMSFGRPFIANDVGAASELAVGGSKVLPLIENLWVKEIKHLQSKVNSPIERILQESYKYTWDKVAKNIENICNDSFM